mmetsp:Transcript_6186/g.14221  ORF Transcript_6186/g.14221 Transcript_6186/m.14221 type:complete len:284 (-) Transcript_6186:1242-2093(-)
MRGALVSRRHASSVQRQGGHGEGPARGMDAPPLAALPSTRLRTGHAPQTGPLRRPARAHLGQRLRLASPYHGRKEPPRRLRCDKGQIVERKRERLRQSLRQECRQGGCFLRWQRKGDGAGLRCVPFCVCCRPGHALCFVLLRVHGATARPRAWPDQGTASRMPRTYRGSEPRSGRRRALLGLLEWPRLGQGNDWTSCSNTVALGAAFGGPRCRRSCDQGLPVRLRGASCSACHPVPPACPDEACGERRLPSAAAPKEPEHDPRALDPRRACLRRRGCLRRAYP